MFRKGPPSVRVREGTKVARVEYIARSLVPVAIGPSFGARLERHDLLMAWRYRHNGLNCAAGKVHTNKSWRRRYAFLHADRKTEPIIETALGEAAGARDFAHTGFFHQRKAIAR